MPERLVQIKYVSGSGLNPKGHLAWALVLTHTR